MKRILREYRLEIIALLLALLGVFLLVEQFEIRKSLLNMYLWLVAFLRQAGEAVKAGLVAYVTSFTLSDLVGWILILLTSVFIAWRIRYRFSKAAYWQAYECPHCGSDLHRVHRSFLDRLLSWTLLPKARRYRCANSECDWSGLRRRKPRSTR